MQQAFPDISPEVKQRLIDQGIKPFAHKAISNHLNPYKNEYWFANALIGSICLVGRYYAKQQQSVRVIYSATLIAIPLLAVATKVRFDSLRSFGQYRKSIEEQLDWYPLTRRAWERALKTQEEYRESLKSEIAELESRKK